MSLLFLTSCTVDFDRSLIRRGGEELSLTPNEAALLRYLAARPGQLVDRAEVDRVVFGIAPTARSRAAPMAVRRLRAKLEDDPAHPVHLHTLRGRGFRLDVPEGPPDVAPPGGLLGRGGLWRELVRTRQPWVTLVGPPGVGKSALARTLLDRAPDARVGIWAGLQAARTLEDVLLAVGRSVAAPRASAAELGWALRGRRLVLDGAEGCLAAVCKVAAAWHAETAVVVTSQAPVGHPEEVVFEVPPLDESASLALLESRARAAWPGFRPDPAEQEARVQLARHLDGLPLALEIVGSRLAVMSAEALLDRITHRRPAGLREVLWRAWALLDDEERRVLGALAAFAGSARVDDLDAVSQRDCLDVLGRLITRGLVTRTAEGVSLLDSVRALARTQTPGEWAERHAAHAVAATESTWQQRWREPEDRRLLSRWLDDLRRAAASDVSPELRIRAARITGHVLTLRGAVATWRDLLTEVGAAAGTTRGLRLDGACVTYHLGDKQAAVPELQGLVDEGAADGVEAEARRWLALAAEHRGDRPESLRQASACLELARALDLPRLALLARQVQSGLQAPAEARLQLLDILDACEAMGDAFAATVTRNQLAVQEQALGQVARALELFRQVLAHAEAEGHQRLRAVCFDNLATVLLELGELEEAERALATLEPLAKALELPSLMARAHGRRGVLRILQGRPAAAEHELRRAVAGLEAAGEPAEVIGYQVLQAIACALLDDPEGGLALLPPVAEADSWDRALMAILLAPRDPAAAAARIDGVTLPEGPAGAFVAAAGAHVAVARGDRPAAQRTLAALEGRKTLQHAMARLLLTHALAR